MKPHVPIVLALALATATASSARAEVVRTQYQFRGERAEAEFRWQDGCVEGWLFVAGGETVTHQAGGAPVESGLAYAWFSAYDWCTGAIQRGVGEIDGGAVIESFERASISVPIELYAPVCSDGRDGEPRCEWLPSGAVAMLRVEILGEGEAVHGVTMTRTSSGSFRSTSREVGTSRQARASAALTLEGVDLVAGWIEGHATIASSTSSQHRFERF